MLMTMKPTKFIHPNRVSTETVPGTLHGPNDYQYYREYDNGWTISITCNYATHDFEKGYFEIKVETLDPHIIGTSLDFDEAARFLREFETNPETTMFEWLKSHPEIESGI